MFCYFILPLWSYFNCLILSAIDIYYIVLILILKKRLSLSLSTKLPSLQISQISLYGAQGHISLKLILSFFLFFFFSDTFPEQTKLHRSVCRATCHWHETQRENAGWSLELLLRTWRPRPRCWRCVLTKRRAGSWWSSPCTPRTDTWRSRPSRWTPPCPRCDPAASAARRTRTDTRLF